ncbi:hypothetical protein GGTG_14397 [Gaeumannomyces tritici R3-111a-1]|uniref:Uncharacterized protein n=1 Tax=Gaeumannomyces tritici (strain R3-111a-1) TaxID=644352 RepID=J3PLD2_GAET3|nr:hypothetical protein GGTG_14397 [Gaeumannomyces tritici R3-111a-1]EJT68024.1 hypothetical protein GGTG_14397 [Gaeumannomyces tritici R3-111a-1]
MDESTKRDPQRTDPDSPDSGGAKGRHGRPHRTWGVTRKALLLPPCPHTNIGGRPCEPPAPPPSWSLSAARAG